MAAIAAKPLSSPKHVLVTGPPGVGKTTLICRVCELLQQRHGVAVRGFYTQEVREEGGGGRGRGRGLRIGFDVVTLDGRRGPLARTDRADSANSSLATKKSPCVGKYHVDIGSFEAVALPALDLKAFSRTPTFDKTGRGVVTGGASSSEPTDRTQVSSLKKVLVIDEIGKMELFCRDFVAKVRSLFEETSHSPTSGCGQRGVILLATIPVQRPQQKSHWLLEDIRQRKDCKLYEVNEKNRDQLVQEIISFILQSD